MSVVGIVITLAWTQMICCSSSPMRVYVNICKPTRLAEYVWFTQNTHNRCPLFVCVCGLRVMRWVWGVVCVSMFCKKLALLCTLAYMLPIMSCYAEKTCRHRTNRDNIHTHNVHTFQPNKILFQTHKTNKTLGKRCAHVYLSVNKNTHSHKQTTLHQEMYRWGRWVYVHT